MNNMLAGWQEASEREREQIQIRSANYSGLSNNKQIAITTEAGAAIKLDGAIHVYQKAPSDGYNAFFPSTSPLV